MIDDGEGGGTTLTLLTPGYSGTGAGGADGLTGALLVLTGRAWQTRGFSLGSDAWFNLQTVCGGYLNTLQTMQLFSARAGRSCPCWL